MGTRILRPRSSCCSRRCSSSVVFFWPTRGRKASFCLLCAVFSLRVESARACADFELSWHFRVARVAEIEGSSEDVCPRRISCNVLHVCRTSRAIVLPMSPSISPRVVNIWIKCRGPHRTLVAYRGPSKMRGLRRMLDDVVVIMIK